VTSEGNTQTSRVTNEGDTQVAAVISTGINTRVQKTSDTGSAVIPTGTTAQRDGSPVSGYLRYNTTTPGFEGYTGSSWDSIGGGGLKWAPYSINKTAIKDNGYMMDTSSSTLVVTPIDNPAVGDSFGVADHKDTFHLNSCTIAFTGSKVQGIVQGESMTLDTKGQKAVFVWSGSDQGWIITDMLPVSNAFEYMPYAVMHVQDQKPSGTAGGSSVSGTQTRTWPICFAFWGMTRFRRRKSQT
jgi:hypothetical protein